MNKTSQEEQWFHDLLLQLGLNFSCMAASDDNIVDVKAVPKSPKNSRTSSGPMIEPSKGDVGVQVQVLSCESARQVGPWMPLPLYYYFTRNQGLICKGRTTPSVVPTTAISINDVGILAKVNGAWSGGLVIFATGPPLAYAFCCPRCVLEWPSLIGDGEAVRILPFSSHAGFVSLVVGSAGDARAASVSLSQSHPWNLCHNLSNERSLRRNANTARINRSLLVAQVMYSDLLNDYFVRCEAVLRNLCSFLAQS